jgi:hypothetical protein
MAHRIYPLLALVAFLQTVFADEFNCKVTLNNREYDLNQLYGLHYLYRPVTTRPSRFLQELTFDLCAVLPKNSTLDDWAQVSIMSCFAWFRELKRYGVSVRKEPEPVYER